MEKFKKGDLVKIKGGFRIYKIVESVNNSNTFETIDAKKALQGQIAVILHFYKDEYPGWGVDDYYYIKLLDYDKNVKTFYNTRQCFYHRAHHLEKTSKIFKLKYMLKYTFKILLNKLKLKIKQWKIKKSSKERIK